MVAAILPEATVVGCLRKVRIAPFVSSPYSTRQAARKAPTRSREAARMSESSTLTFLFTDIEGSTSKWE